jgi:hypothetical protein
MLKRPTEKSKIAREVAKCTLLCANCHAEVHAGIRRIPANIKRVSFEVILAAIDYRGTHRKVWKFYKCAQCGKPTNHHGAGKNRRTFCSYDCARNYRRKFERPSKDELQILIDDTPMVQVAKKYGVGTSMIMKLCRNLGVITRPRGYWMKRRAKHSPVV